MRIIHLEILLRIIGIGSASGLLHRDNTLLVISDNAGYLYEYTMPAGPLSKNALFENDVMENIPKAIKTDFEAMAQYNDRIYLFGSGSTANRNMMITIDRDSKNIISTVDLSDFYAVLQSFGSIKPGDFNIEGAVYDGTQWYLFQRGNNGSGSNGVFTIAGDIQKHDFSVVYNPVKLPRTGGVEYCFTDALLLDDTLYFVATAENTQNAYDDGDVLGSIIGTIDVNSMKVKKTRKISSSQKFEGIALYEKGLQNLSFLLCEDNDSDFLESNIYKLTISK